MNRRLAQPGLLVLASWLLLAVVAAPALADCSVPVEIGASRPDPEGVPTRVEVGLYLIDLQKIDDAEQAFSADLLLSLSWRDARLVSAERSPSLAGCKIGLDSLWNPAVLLVNERRVAARLANQVRIDERGMVSHAQRYQGQFSSPLDLRDFPFDRQLLGLQLISRGHTPEEVELVVDQSKTGISENLTIAEWGAGDPRVEIDPMHLEAADRTLPRIVFRLEVRRETGYYLWKVLIPLSLIICMAGAVFWINPSYLPSQIGVATSAVLTLIAFQFSLGYLLPRLSYLTRADRFVLGSTALVFAAFGEAILSGYVAARDRLDTAMKIDRMARWIYPLGFLTVIAWSLWF